MYARDGVTWGWDEGLERATRDTKGRMKVEKIVEQRCVHPEREAMF